MGHVRGARAAPSPPLLLLLLAVASAVAAEKTKRQIFREQLLPHRGGKIPEEAFRTDRLALNRLNKEGIAVPDGVLLDARRRAHHHPRHNSDLERSVVKVLVSGDGRFVAPEGRLRPQRPLTVDSTYIIRPPVGSRQRPPPAVGRPLQGPELQIPTKAAAPQPRPGPSRAAAAPPPPPFASFAAFDPFNGLYSTGALDDLDAVLAQLNARAERDALAAAWAPLGHCAPPGAAATPRLLADAVRCQVFHVCQRDGRRDTFLCPSGTLFSAALGRCDWWFNVQC